MNNNLCLVVSHSHKCGGGSGKENKKILFNDEDEYKEDVPTKVKVISPHIQGGGSGFGQKPDPKLCTASKGRFLKIYRINILDHF